MARVPQWRKPRSRASALDERPSCGHGDGPRDRGGRAARTRHGHRPCAARRARGRGRDRCRATAASIRARAGATAPTRRMSRSRSRARWRLAFDREPGMRAVLTRDGDYFIALPERMERARKTHADFFVSIHADSVRDPLISGASVYMLSERGASSEAARRLAEEENAADLNGGISLAAQTADLRSVLLDRVAERVHRPERRGRRARAQRPDGRRRGAQARGAAGCLRGAQVALYSLDAGRDRLHLQSAPTSSD